MDIESYKFWDIVELWGREQLIHEILIAKRLAVGVVKEGLRFQSTNPKWLSSETELMTYPYVGYSARPGESPIILKADVLEHLLSVASEKVDASKLALQNEVVTKHDFKAWLVRTGQSFPKFWYVNENS
jgi:hypothetical protein